MKAVLHVFRERYGFLSLAVALTLLVRLVYGLLIFDHIADRYSWRLDDQYSDIAYTLVTTGKYALSETSPPTMMRLPIHPLMLAGVFAIFGRSLVAVRIVQCLLCAVTCVMVYLTAKEVTNERVAAIASVIFALYPNSILYSARTLSETTYSFILSIFCLALVRQFKAPSVRTSIASGLSFGVLMLTKSITMLLPPFLLLVLLCADYRKRLWSVLVCIIAIMLVAALVISPWVIRNHRLTGRIIVSSTWGGTPFYQGYYLATHLSDGRSGLQLDHDAGREARRLVRERYTPIGQPIDEYRQDRAAYLLVWEKITARPLYSFWIFLRNIGLVWFLTYGRTKTVISLFVHMPLLMIATYAVLAMVRQDRDAWVRALPLVLICAYFNLLHAVVYPHVRYMSPVVGTIVTILAAYGILRLISWGRSSWSRYQGKDLPEVWS